MSNDKTKQTVYNIFDSNDSSVSSFNSYLVAALKRQGIDVIIDKTCTKLEKGRFLGIKLVLVVLSSPFIFSVACLENLVKLHEFLQEKGNVGVPVFYNKGVSVLKEQMEMCETLAVLEKSYSVDQVTKWRRALVKTMDLQGHEYNNKLRKQSEFIEMIAQDVFEKLYPTEHIGIHKVLLELENLLCKQPWGLRTLAILGKLGIGKTTLVKAAFRKMSSGYDAYRFIIVSDEKKIELLSNEDFKEIPMEKFDLNNQEPCHRSKRVLIVLDDVRDALDVKDFLSGFARFGLGSLLIITSRDRPVLEECHVNEIYELKGLNNEDSLKLFTRCCFGEDVLDEELRKLAVRDIEHCDGNPSTIRSYAEKKKGKKTAVSFPLQAVQEPSVPCPQVFINFRGAELRQNFISFLEPALKTAGINVFVDKNEKRGGDLTALFRRIEESKIALVVFSRRYMESKGCLNELAKIKERVDEEKLVAIPIFFKVKPAELKELLDDACKISHGNVEAHILKKWKVALECIRSKLGLSLEEKSDEADFIKKIVDEVKQRLGDIPSLEGEGLEMATPFGIEHRIKQVEEKLDFAHCDETRIVGIVGMPGIGKTTLAMALFKKSRQRFVRCVAFMKIREKWMEFGPNRVRKMFLEDLIQNTSINITDETIHDCFEDILLCNKVFLVLDDVSSKRQIEVLFGNGNWIKKGSRIVITTRDRAIITELDPNPYVVPRLNFGDGLMYFSFYAFEDHICNPEMGEYMKMSREFVDYATGNPLVLRVLGRDLRRKGEVQWRERLDTLAKSPNKSIQDILKISFDELSELEKDVFLDIACFFRSESEYYARSLLDSGDNEPFQAAREITDLSHKFFISISGGSVEMHDILHTFAMELCSLTSCGVNQEKCRLLNGNSIMAALHGKIETKTVRGISLDMSDVPNMPLDRLVFTKMCNLRYLKLYSSTCPRECKGDCKLHFPDGLSFPLKEVRYLDWLKYPLEELPSDFNPKNLVDLRLPYSKIIQVWIVSKDTPKLKWVDLNNSRMLQTLSGFSMAPNLLRLNLEGCTSLVCLSEEMRTMESLVLLNLRGCTSLLHLPKINLCSLRTLILSGCSKLHEFGLISENLEYLYLDGTAIEDLPPNIVKLQRLIILNLKECRRLGSFPECIGKLKALQELILSGCSNLKSFPNVEENMENFQVLLLDGTSIEEVPKITRGSNSLSFLRRLSLSRNDVISSLGSDISQLYHLKWLDLKYCKNLRSLSTLPPNLQCLDAHDCISLETVTSPLAFLMPMEDIHSMFIFTNCCKLDDAAKNDIASHIRRKCQLISDDHHNESFVFRALIGTCYPGYEVPPWFSHQAFDSVLEPKLPPHWCDNKFLGLALCAIVSFHDYRDQNNRLLVKCTCEFENLDASCSLFSVPVGGWFEPGHEPRTIESDHVFIGYISWLNIKKLQEEEYKKGCVPTKAKLRFLVTDGTGEEIAQCEVVKCGFGLVYEPDDEVSDDVLSTRTKMNGEVSTFISAEDSDYQGDTQGDTPTTARIFFDYFKKK